MHNTFSMQFRMHFRKLLTQYKPNSLYCTHYKFISTTSQCLDKVAGKYRTTKYKTFPLTYEMSIQPPDLGVKKSWMTWNTHSLLEFEKRGAKMVAEDEIIRRMVRGMMPGYFAKDELIIKRRGNLIVLAGIILERPFPEKTYWLIGFTESMLEYLLKQPVKMEVQVVKNIDQVIFKYI